MTQLSFTPEKAAWMTAIAANEAKGDQIRLESAIHNGLAADLTVSQIKEALSQLYAYTGFPRSLNALGTLQRVIGTQAYANSRFLYYINEIRSAVMILHGEKAHSRYFGEAAYHYMVDGKAEGYRFVGQPNPVPENKQLIIIPGASHCDLYDGGDNNYIPFDRLAEFYHEYLK